MDQLLKDYLENNEFSDTFKDVRIVSHNYNAHMCKVNFICHDTAGFEQSLSKHLDIWSVVSFVYESKK